MRAEDAEDLAVIAACLQDALVRVDQMAFVRGERRFAAVLDRFKWEDAPSRGVGRGRARSGLKQVTAGLRFDGVRAVKVRGLDQADRTRLLELLTVVCGDGPGGAAAPGPRDATIVTLVFAGGGQIRLEVDRLVCHLEDLGTPRPTPLSPIHELDEGR